MADYTPQDFATTLLRRLKIKPTPGALKSVEGWVAAEGGHWHNQAKYNPLNTTQGMPGAGNTGSQGNIKVYQNWGQGLDATVKTLNNGRYGSIIAALQKGDPNAFVSALGSSPWGTSADLIRRTVLGAKGTPGSVIPGSSSAPDATRASYDATSLGSIPGATQATPGTPSVYDVIAQYRDATQKIQAQPLYGQQPQTPGLGSIGLSQPYNPQVADQQIQDQVKRIIALRNPTPAPTPVGPTGSRGDSGGVTGLGVATGPSGKVEIFNGNPGRLKPGVVSFAEKLAGRLGRTLRIDSGALHSKYTVDGNVSEHFTGDATDIPMTGKQLTQAGQQALIEAGMDPAKARQQQGGLFNVSTPDGGRYQIIFNTLEGGNHYTHLHVGYRPGKR